MSITPIIDDEETEADALRVQAQNIRDMSIGYADGDEWPTFLHFGESLDADVLAALVPDLNKAIQVVLKTHAKRLDRRANEIEHI